MLAVDTGFAGGFVDALTGVLVLEAEETLDAAECTVMIGGDDGVCPVQGVGAHANDFLSEVMDGLGDAAAASTYPENVAVFTFFEPSVAGDFFHFMIEGADHGAVPTHPDLFSNVLRGDLVVGAFDFDVAVAVDLTGSFFKARKEVDGQGLEGWFFSFFKMGAYLLFGSTVDAFVGDVCCPPAQVCVDFGEAVKGFSGQGVVFDVFYAAFDFALVGGLIGPCGHD